jgi:purine-binding chemotaxis protein CheW
MTGLAKTMDQAVKAMADREGKFLTFSLKGEEYGIEIRKVKEIIGMIPITMVPQTPQYFKGVINLRGKVIPVVDLRLKFGMEAMDYTERTCIVVVDLHTGILMGLVVDTVSEVLNIKANDIEDTPSFGASVNTNYILGMAKAGNGIKILLDIDKVMSDQEIDILRTAVQ